MAKKIIIGNWKMNPRTEKEAIKLAKASDFRDVVLCVPFIFLSAVKKVLKRAKLGAEDVAWGDVGAMTGEISAGMLYNLGVKYVILGHSERRALNESNLDVNKKIKAALASGLVPILCVGESVRDESHSYFNLVKTQLEECLDGVKKTSIAKIIVAYEPVWAISTTANRKDATPADSLEMSIFIRKILSDKFGSDAGKTRIIYGGSANEKDAREFLENGGVDGLLPGRASLDPKKFAEIIKIAEKIS